MRRVLSDESLRVPVGRVGPEYIIHQPKTRGAKGHLTVATLSHTPGSLEGTERGAERLVALPCEKAL